VSKLIYGFRYVLGRAFNFGVSVVKNRTVSSHWLDCVQFAHSVDLQTASGQSTFGAVNGLACRAAIASVVQFRTSP
jgi:hypothetical protein